MTIQDEGRAQGECIEAAEADHDAAHCRDMAKYSRRCLTAAQRREVTKLRATRSPEHGWIVRRGCDGALYVGPACCAYRAKANALDNFDRYGKRPSTYAILELNGDFTHEPDTVFVCPCCRTRRHSRARAEECLAAHYREGSASREEAISLPAPAPTALCPRR